MAARQAFIWQDIEHWVGKDLMDTLQLLSDQDEADSFLLAYAEACEDDDHALHNLRYIAQCILSDDEDPDAQGDAERICEWFGLEVPTREETISPRHWWKGSSYGLKLQSTKRPELEPVEA